MCADRGLELFAVLDGTKEARRDFVWSPCVQMKGAALMAGVSSPIFACVKVEKLQLIVEIKILKILAVRSF